MCHPEEGTRPCELVAPVQGGLSLQLWDRHGCHQSPEGPTEHTAARGQGCGVISPPAPPPPWSGGTRSSPSSAWQLCQGPDPHPARVLAGPGIAGVDANPAWHPQIGVQPTLGVTGSKLGSACD